MSDQNKIDRSPQQGKDKINNSIKWDVGRVGWFIIGCMLVVVFIVILLYLYNDKRVFILRTLFVSIFTILPAIMYYVFIASRKSSLFQEFVSNLNRLGLLDYYKVEGEAEGNGEGLIEKK